MRNNVTIPNARPLPPISNPPGGDQQLGEGSSIPPNTNRAAIPAKAFPPSNIALGYFGTEEGAKIFREFPDFIHPALRTLGGLTFLKTRAERAWTSGDRQLAYRLQYAAFNNELRISSRDVPSIPKGDIFQAGHFIANYLAGKGIAYNEAIIKQFYGACEGHARLLDANKLNKAELGKVLDPIQEGVKELLYKVASLAF